MATGILKEKTMNLSIENITKLSFGEVARLGLITCMATGVVISLTGNVPLGIILLSATTFISLIATVFAAVNM